MSRTEIGRWIRNASEHESKSAKLSTNRRLTAMPGNPRRMSVCPVTSHTRTPAGTGIAPRPSSTGTRRTSAAVSISTSSRTARPLAGMTSMRLAAFNSVAVADKATNWRTLNDADAIALAAEVARRVEQSRPGPGGYNPDADRQHSCGLLCPGRTAIVGRGFHAESSVRSTSPRIADCCEANFRTSWRSAAGSDAQPSA